MKKKARLLAPAGDMECLLAAVSAGADEVYLGGKRYGARAFAANFTDDEIKEAIRLTRFSGVKLFLTVNTLTKEKEMDDLIRWLVPFYETGLDGVIVQDLGVLSRCRQAFPELLLHASTQMTVTEASAALFLKKLGVSRVVPARELSLVELNRLKRESGLELETFIHGALCYCYSGQCLFSSMLGGRSANRGRCAQPCRLPYEIEGGSSDVGTKKKASAFPYPLSLKDLCVLPFLPKLMEAGIDAFKIEGRMKNAAYVAGVTALYRKYMDLYETDPKNWRVDPKDWKLLEQLYVRTDPGSGYYERHNGQEMITPGTPGYYGISREVSRQAFQVGNGRRTQRGADFSVFLYAGSPARFLARCGEESVCVEGPEVQKAVNRALTEEDVKRQFSKTGTSHFYPENLSVELGDSVFLPVSALNDLRRKGLDALYEKLAEAGTKRAASVRLAEAAPALSDSSQREEPIFSAFAQEIEQAVEILRCPAIRRLTLSSDTALAQDPAASFWQAVRTKKETDRAFSLFLSLPVILRAYSKPYLERLARFLDTQNGALVDGFLVSSLSGLIWAFETGKKVSVNHTLPVCNRETLALLLRHFQIDSYTPSLELTRRELDLLPVSRQERLVYGRIPMMVSANCVRKTAGDCKTVFSQENGQQTNRLPRRYFYLTDRYRTRFPVQIDCGQCMNTIYNSVPLSLHLYLDELKKSKVAALRLDFTDEDQTAVRQILALFTQNAAPHAFSYTTGHYKKGVS